MKKNKPWQTMWRVCATLFALLWMSQVLYAVDVSVTVDKPMKDGVVEISLGQSVQLTAHAPSDKIRWQSRKNGTQKYIAMKDDAGNYIVENPLVVTPVESTDYRIMYTDDTGSYFSEPPITIIVVAPRDLIISANKNKLSLGEDVTLTAETESDVLLGRVRWQKQVGSGDFEDMRTDTGAPVIGQTVTDIPQAGGTCYRAIGLKASGEEVISEPVCVTSEYTCSTNSAYVIFTDDFGKLDSETARNSNQYVGKDYTYVSGCGRLQAEGTYAVMANARYGGCNVDGVTDGCGCTHASNDQMWFRDIYDHTQGGVDSENKYGGMLLVNANAEKVYSRTITLPCANTNLIFSAWFATASKGATSSVRFFVTGSNGEEIKEATFPIEDIDFADGWIKGETSFYTGDETTFTVEIHNYREGTDKGNDFLIDDISFSVCSPQIGLYAESTSDQVEIDAVNNMVQGPCDEPVTLQVKTSMVDVIYDDPQYLWFIKDADDTEFRHLENNKNQTSLPTAITPYTQYYVVTAASEDDARNYLEGKFTCTPVAVSNTITVLCTPNLEITLQSRKCNDIVLKGTAYDAPNDFYFWWEKSADGKNWQKIPRAAKTDTLHYTLSEPLYFRINSEYTPSDPTEKLDVKALTLKANPDKGISGSLVQLIATATNLNMDGALYQWYRYEDEVNPDTRDNWWFMTGTSDATLEHSIDRPVDRIKVTADGCEDEVEIKEIAFDIEPIDRKCNDIYLQPIATLGGEPIAFKWQRSADGSTWVDVASDAIADANDDNCPDCVTITIAEKSIFRLAEIDAAGVETGIYSDTQQAELYEVKALTLTADPTKIKKDSGAKLTLAYENFDATTAAQWFVVKGDNDEEFTPSSSTEHIIASLSETTTYKVTWDLCEATATVNVIQPASVAFMSRDCNTITMQATVDDTYGEFFWETSKDGIEWEKLAGKENQTSINVTIAETTYFRVNNALDMPSDASYANDVHSITLEVDKEEINRDEQVTLTATADFSSNFAIKWYQNGEEIDNTANPYSPTLQTDATFYVELEGCESESVSINVIQPASVEFVSRVCNEITLSATVEEGVSYKWQKSKDGNTWTDMSETGSPITVTITENTKFRVKTDDVKSEPTDIIELWGVTLSVDKNSVILGEEVNVTATSSSSEPIVWYENNQPLDFDGDVYTVKPYGPTSFQVTQGGCPSKTVTVTDVLWPTVFTPMLADGFNDDFIQGMNPAVALKIYDRYGNLVIETTDGWDGKDAKGNYAMPGVYYYVATLSNGDVQKGNVELLNEKK